MNLFDKSKKTNLLIIPNKTTLLNNLPEELKNALTEGYSSKDIEDKIGASLINACFTMKLSHFCIGRTSLRYLLKNDANFKGNIFNNNNWPIIKAKLLNMGLFTYLNSSGRKLSAISIDNEDFLNLIGLSPAQVELQRKHVMLYSSPKDTDINIETADIFAGEVNLSAAKVIINHITEEPKTPTEEPKTVDPIPAYANEESEPESEILEPTLITDAQFDSIENEVIKMCTLYPKSASFQVSRIISLADRGLVVINESDVEGLVYRLSKSEELTIHTESGGWWTIKLK